MGKKWEGFCDTAKGAWVLGCMIWAVVCFGSHLYGIGLVIANVGWDVVCFKGLGLLLFIPAGILRGLFTSFFWPLAVVWLAVAPGEVLDMLFAGERMAQAMIESW